MISDSVKFSTRSDGSNGGYAACLFETPEGARKAMEEHQGQNLGERWIDLGLKRYQFWESYGQ